MDQRSGNEEGHKVREKNIVQGSSFKLEPWQSFILCTEEINEVYWSGIIYYGL